MILNHLFPQNVVTLIKCYCNRFYNEFSGNIYLINNNKLIKLEIKNYQDLYSQILENLSLDRHSFYFNFTLKLYLSLINYPIDLDYLENEIIKLDIDTKNELLEALRKDLEYCSYIDILDSLCDNSIIIAEEFKKN